MDAADKLALFRHDWKANREGLAEFTQLAIQSFGLLKEAIHTSKLQRLANPTKTDPEQRLIESIVENAAEVVAFPETPFDFPGFDNSLDQCNHILLEFSEWTKTRSNEVVTASPWEIRQLNLSAWFEWFSDIPGRTTTHCTFAGITSGTAHACCLNSFIKLWADHAGMIAMTDFAPELRAPLFKSIRNKWAVDAIDAQLFALERMLLDERKAAELLLNDAPKQKKARNPKGQNSEKIIKAVLMLKDDPNQSNAKIADAVGVSASSLSRSKMFNDARRACIGQPPRGFQNKDGSIDGMEKD